MHWKFGERSIVWKLLLMYANEKHPTFAMLSFLPVSKTWPIHTAWKSHQKILFYNIAAKMRTFLKTKKIVKFCLLYTFNLTIFSRICQFFLSFPELVRTPCNYMSKFLALKFKMRLFLMISGIFQSFWMMQLSNYNSGFVKCISLLKVPKRIFECFVLTRNPILMN